MTFLAGLLAGVAGMPRWIKIAAVVALAALALLLLHRCAVQDAVEADRTAAEAAALAKAREADERAHAAVAGGIDGVAEGNRAAADAAAGSEDPLKAGLDKLREGK